MKTPKPRIKKSGAPRRLFDFKAEVSVYSLKPRVLKPLFRLGAYQPFSPFCHPRAH